MTVGHTGGIVDSSIGPRHTAAAAAANGGEISEPVAAAAAALWRARTCARASGPGSSGRDGRRRETGKSAAAGELRLREW
jgi:hypothetical protein